MSIETIILAFVLLGAAIWFRNRLDRAERSVRLLEERLEQLCADADAGQKWCQALDGILNYSQQIAMKGGCGHE